MKSLWNESVEKEFFLSALKSSSTPDKLFYKLGEEYYAYIPKGFSPEEGKALQNRNYLIGSFTEKWCQKLFLPIAEQLDLYAVNGVNCDEMKADNFFELLGK